MTRFLNKEIVDISFGIFFVFVLLCFLLEILFKVVLLCWLKSFVFLDLVGNTGSCDLLFPVLGFANCPTIKVQCNYILRSLQVSVTRRV